MFSYFLAIALQLGASAPSVALHELHSAFTRVSTVAEQRGSRMHLAYEPGDGRTPLSSWVEKDGTCHVSFDTSAEGFRVLDMLVDGVPVEQRIAFLEAVFAHELAHCEQFNLARQDFKRSAIVNPALASRIRSFADLRSAWGGRELTLWVELLADVAAGIYLDGTHPQECEALMGALLENRRRFAAQDSPPSRLRFVSAANSCRPAPSPDTKKTNPPLALRCQG